MSDASCRGIHNARQEGLRSLGKGISDCPYTRTGLQRMSRGDQQLADAWCAGLIEAEAIERERKAKG